MTTTSPAATIYDTWNASGIAFADTDAYRLISTLASEVSDQLDASSVDDDLDDLKALRAEAHALGSYMESGIYSLLAQVY